MDEESEITPTQVYTFLLLQLNEVVSKLSTFIYNRRETWPTEELSQFARIFTGTDALVTAHAHALGMPDFEPEVLPDGSSVLHVTIREVSK